MPWIVLGECVTGTAHHTRSVPCQDAFRVRCLGPDGEWLVVAVADGAGTAAHADVGATLVCEELVRRVGPDRLEFLSTHEAMTALFTEVRAALLAEAGQLGVSPRELACTALLAVVGPTSAVVTQIGDGAIVLGDGGGQRVVFWPDPAEYANATDFLSEERFADALRFEAVAGPVAELAVLTDGLQRLALDFAARTPHAPFFRPLFDQLRLAPDPDALAEPFRGFLDSPQVNARTDDDKTLVLAVRRP